MPRDEHEGVHNDHVQAFLGQVDLDHVLEPLGLQVLHELLKALGVEQVRDVLAPRGRDRHNLLLCRRADGILREETGPSGEVGDGLLELLDLHRRHGYDHDEKRQQQGGHVAERGHPERCRWVVILFGGWGGSVLCHGSCLSGLFEVGFRVFAPSLAILEEEAQSLLNHARAFSANDA